MSVAWPEHDSPDWDVPLKAYIDAPGNSRKFWGLYQSVDDLPTEGVAEGDYAFFISG